MNFRKLFDFRSYLGAGLAGLVGLVLSFALTAPVHAVVTMPDVSTTTIEDAGTKILAAVAVLVAIAMGIRLFKRG